MICRGSALSGQIRKEGHSGRVRVKRRKERYEDGSWCFHTGQRELKGREAGQRPLAPVYLAF